jgi:hypothetical protein
LGLNVAVADFDCIEFVATYAAQQDFATAGGSVEVPSSQPFINWQREGPIFVADEQGCDPGIASALSDALSSARLSCEFRRHFLVPGWFAAVNDVVAAGPENLCQSFLVVFFSGIDQSVGCPFRCGKRLGPGRRTGLGLCG